ncbi:MAG: trypsin-like peptidase domain-containing protein [Candidatus Peregrinibacteria bacterium]
MNSGRSPVRLFLWFGGLLIFSVGAGALGTVGVLKFFPPQGPSSSVVQIAPPPGAVKEVIAENAYMDVSQKLEHSVVSIVATKELQIVLQNPYAPFNDPFFNDFFGDPFQQRQPQQPPEVKKEKQEVGAGTGFVVTKEGILLTNKHVVSDPQAEYTAIFSDGTQYSATVLARDPVNDIAFLKIKAEASKTFVPVQFIDAIDAIRVGQMVVAMGNALGQFQNTITSGIISAKGRKITAADGTGGAEQLQELLQTDAAINPGNSGGPLVSLEGKVLGMNTAIASGAEGIGFAIPLDQKKVDVLVAQVQKNGKIIRPFLGIRYQPITAKLNAEKKLGSDTGAWVHGQNDLPAVLPNTPAAKAGIQGGDIILKADDIVLDEKTDLQSIIQNHNVGDTIKFTILRNGKQETIPVVLEALDVKNSPTPLVQQ